MNQDMLDIAKNGKGFIAALDQSGGSTPKALAQYGVSEDQYNGEDEMFAEIHKMRARIITSPAFSGEKIIGAILFEKTMDGEIEGKPTPAYLWENLKIVPYLKVDKGLEDEKDGVQLMKAMPELDVLLERAAKAGIFGTKMRSVIHSANAAGIEQVVAQQFEVGKQILRHGLVPIIEPEVSINAPDKQECEDVLNSEILKQLDLLTGDQKVMLKLTLPEQAGFYSDLVKHERVVRVVALSGGYDLDEACKRLAENDGIIASFSRALSNDLKAGQSQEEFDGILASVIDKIYNASIAGKTCSQAA